MTILITGAGSGLGEGAAIGMARTATNDRGGSVMASSDGASRQGRETWASIAAGREVRRARSL